MRRRMKVLDIAYRGVAGSIEVGEVRKWSAARDAWVVRGDQPASTIAPAIEHNEVRLIIVTDPDDPQQVAGVLSPLHVRTEVDRHFGTVTRGSFVKAVEVLEKNPKAANVFGHEYLNAVRPTFYYCEKGGHILYDKPPCPTHDR